jgi:hypothetical protein
VEKSFQLSHPIFFAKKKKPFAFLFSPSLFSFVFKKDGRQKKIIKKRKSFFTLLELSVAFSLISIIVFFLLVGLKNFFFMEKKIERAKEDMMQNMHLQIRCNHLFSQLLPSSFLTRGTPALYTSLFPKETQNCLICAFDNGLDPDPKFSGPVLGRIFLNKNKELHLILWPLEKDGSIPTIYREEKLLTNVEKISFEFFTQEKKGTSLCWRWVSKWPEEKKELPSMIRLCYQRQGKKIPFAFFPPFAPPISYDKERQ